MEEKQIHNFQIFCHFDDFDWGEGGIQITSKGAFKNKVHLAQ
jgi:hypothetical protein